MTPVRKLCSECGHPFLTEDSNSNQCQICLGDLFAFLCPNCNDYSYVDVDDKHAFCPSCHVLVAHHLSGSYSWCTCSLCARQFKSTAAKATECPDCLHNALEEDTFGKELLKELEKQAKKAEEDWPEIQKILETKVIVCPVCQINKIPYAEKLCKSCLKEIMQEQGLESKPTKTKTAKPKPKPGQRKVQIKDS